MKRQYLDYLNDMLELASDAIKFIEGMSYEDFLEDKKTNFAVFRALEVIGEAVSKIPVPIRSLYPTIPWKSIYDMRNKLIHEYIGVDYEIVWDTVKSSLPALIPELLLIIDDYKKNNPDLFKR
ncbi:MAG: nucleotidyltransferase [Ignavibacteria bacterium]|nr:nucleotidyltransferase [Ignavibacteria bacterium]